MLGDDALYLGKPFLKLCDEYNFEYIIRYKEDFASSIKKNFDTFKIIKNNYQYQNEVIYGELEHKEFYTVNIISYDENNIDDITGEVKITNFSYITSLTITNKNKEGIVKLER